MLTVIVRGEAGEGKSTLAAYLAGLLARYGIVAALEDDGGPDGATALAESGGFTRLLPRLDAVASRLAREGSAVVIRTEQVHRPPTENPTPAATP